MFKNKKQPPIVIIAKSVVHDMHTTYIGDLRSQLYEARERAALLESIIECSDQKYRAAMQELDLAPEQKPRSRIKMLVGDTITLLAKWSAS